MKGIVTRLPEGKNFGFIRNTDGMSTGDYFFHRQDYADNWNDLLSDFRVGNSVRVEFEQTSSSKGLRAGNVKRLY